MVEQRVSMAEADPYLLFGLLRKQVIHPGGRKATEELFTLAGLGPGEAVTMFVDRDRAIRELVRVCRPGGLVLATEFHWRRQPTPEARQAFLGEVCPGMLFNSVEDWLARYSAAGLADLQVSSGPFEMMTARGSSPMRASGTPSE